MHPPFHRRAVKAYIQGNAVKRAVVVGGGFIGLEMVENLAHMGIEVSVVEMLTQVSPPGWSASLLLTQARIPFAWDLMHGVPACVSISLRSLSELRCRP